MFQNPNIAFGRTAVLVVDMLNDFVTGGLGCERARGIVPAVVQLLDAARRNAVPVIFCNDSHVSGVDQELEFWGDHAIEGTDGAKVIPELKLSEGDYVVPKHHFSAFFDTELDSLLKRLGIDTVVICGIYANICVRHTAADAYQHGYRVIVASDAVDSMTEQEYRESLEYMKKVYGASILPNAELI
ncbi:MAG: cysteine hydrolase [Bacteroidales bacterium]|nr:cysteine hydrolase [Bacteroidales bacterium]